MTSFPLPTLACTIGSTGISSPTYSDILASLIASLQSIYGADIFLDPSAQDYQMCAIFAQAQYDSNQATIAAYANFSPATAQGAGLSSVVKINGLQREVASNSTCPVTVVGQAGTVITNGLIGDNQQLGTQWALPPTVTIPVGGAITVTAICTVQGAVNAAPNTLTVILNPQRGWQSVSNNAASAAPGAPVETDAALRQRQTISTALPAQSVLDGIIGAVANLSGVQRVTAYENDTGATDANSLPPHSISLVVEGGTALTIAQTIASKKTPGTGTYGTTTETVFDSQGIPATINFFSLNLITINVAITVKALTGFVSTTETLIQQAVAAYLSSLSNAETAYLNRLWGPANLSGDAATSATGMTQSALDALSTTYNVVSVAQSRGGPPVSADIIFAIFEAATCAQTNVTITVM